MASSVGSVHTNSDGAGAGARTPTHQAPVSSAAAASELSPPGSQPQQIPDISTASEFKAAEADVAQAPGQGTEQPIAAWNTKRAQDEYQRALEHVVDKDFSLGMCRPVWTNVSLS